MLSVIARHLSMLALIPQCVSMKPRNFPPSTLNIHFSGFNLIFVLPNAFKTSSKSFTC